MTHEPTRRDRLMAALAVAEHLVSASPAEPRAVEVRQGYTGIDADEIGVVLHFVGDAILTYAKAVGATVQHRRGEVDGRPYLETAATGRMDNIPFYAWARADMPTLGQLAEQRHQVEEPAVPPASAAPHIVQTLAQAADANWHEQVAPEAVSAA